jgi:predicted small secreted protein
MQEKLVFAGQLDCYGKAHETIGQFMNLKVSESQVYRVTDAYGGEIGKTVHQERTLPPVKKKEVLYVMVDGSFIYTRKGEWKETKLGRMFTSSDSIRIEGKRSFIQHSQYVGHVGDIHQFIAYMDHLIESYGHLGCQLVFVSDGAPWIRNWVQDSYPEAISILDFYHASHYLYEFADGCVPADQKGSWIKAQKELLETGKVKDVVVNVKGMKADEKSTKKIMDYYTANQDRMDYPQYKLTGSGLIGSGAIESAHRTVVQRRLKLSGQRWTVEGAQNVLNLRVTNGNRQWGKVVNLVKTEFKAAA